MKHRGNFLGFCCGPGLRAEALRCRLLGTTRKRKAEERVKKEKDLPGRSCEAGKGSSLPAAPQLVFPACFSAGLSGSHPTSWRISLKWGVAGRRLPNRVGKCCFPASLLHLPTPVAPAAVGVQEPAPGELQERC